MTTFKKISVLLMTAILAIAFCACSDSENSNDSTALTEEEINNRYEELMKESESELLPEDYNPIVDNFTTVDFQLTDLNNETAFNLPENSYAEITPTSANFRFFDASIQGESFPGSFQTAKALSLANTVDEYLAAYKVTEGSAIAYFEGTYPTYNSTVQTSRITFGFASSDGQNFSLLSADEVTRVLQIRDPLMQAGAGISTTDTDKIVASYQTLATVDIVPSEGGAVNKVTISRFDKSVAAQ